MIESSLTRLPDLIVEDPISICLTCFHFISKVETLLSIPNLLSSQIWVQRKMEKGQMQMHEERSALQKSFFSSQPASLVHQTSLS